MKKTCCKLRGKMCCVKPDSIPPGYGVQYLAYPEVWPTGYHLDQGQPFCKVDYEWGNKVYLFYDYTQRHTDIARVPPLII